jgi:hypothetical protein
MRQRARAASPGSRSKSQAAMTASSLAPIKTAVGYGSCTRSFTPPVVFSSPRARMATKGNRKVAPR